MLHTRGPIPFNFRSTSYKINTRVYRSVELSLLLLFDSCYLTFIRCYITIILAAFQIFWATGLLGRVGQGCAVNQLDQKKTTGPTRIGAFWLVFFCQWSGPVWVGCAVFWLYRFEESPKEVKEKRSGSDRCLKRAIKMCRSGSVQSLLLVQSVQ